MKLKVLALSFFILAASSFSKTAKADGLDPRLKALGTIALYGTVGGAILGTASLAFGANGRWISRGASLGLYGGLIFGGYIVASHAIKQRQKNSPSTPSPGDNYYPDTQGSPYEDGAGGGNYTSDGGQRWNPYLEHQLNAPVEESPRGRSLRKQKAPLFFLNILKTTF